MSDRRLAPAPDVGPFALREVDPARCANGHPFGAGWARGWQQCGCAGGEGHRTWSHGCGAPVIYDPPHDPGWRVAEPYP